jgi:2-aminoadipate transaminase
MTDLIDFGIGQPSPSLLPAAALQTATARELATGSPTLLQYGQNQGDAAVRASLATFLARRYAMPVDAEQLMISAGASQALDLICTRFTRPGDTIFVEAPTYFLALDIFRDHGLTVVGIPTDADGIRVDLLRDALAQHRPALLYTIPSFQNPSAVTMSAARREQLVAISGEHDLLVVADEVYHLLDFGSAPPPPLAAYHDRARILSLGSCSKICAPGLRVGWIQGAPPLLQHLIHLGLVQSGGGLNPFTSGVVRSMIESGLADAGLDMLRGVYRDRCAQLCNALRDELPAMVFSEPQGGYFVWGQLPAHIDAGRLRVSAVSAGVAFHPGSRFTVGGEFASAMRLSFAHYEAAELLEGVRRLASVVAL